MTGDLRTATGSRYTVPLVLAAATILTQISYPLLSGRALVLATAVAVLLFAATSLAHARAALGLRTAAVLLGVAGGLGLLAEAVGTATGFPFGAYEYTGTLGPSVATVPLVIPLAWTMMSWPALLAGRRLAGAVLTRRRTAGTRDGLPSRSLTAVLGGLVLASWDLYLDPQMVAAGHWAWAQPDPGLPGVPGIPLTNYAGWILVSVVVMAALDTAVPRRAVDERVPALLLGWTWLGSFVANLFFFGEPEVALYGVVGMGLLVGPYLYLLSRARART